MALPPLLLGTVHTPIIALVSLLCLLAGAVGCLEARSHGTRVPLSPLSAAALLLCGVSMLQVVPLPEGLLGLLSPEAAAARRAIMSAGLDGIGAGGSVSLAPSRTALAALRWAALAAAGLGAAAILGAHRAHRRTLTGLIARTLAWVGLVEVALGLLQVFLGEPGYVLGIFKTTRASLIIGTGTFINANHGAAFLALCALSATGLALGSEGRKRVGWAAAAVIIATGVLLCASRGGVAALALCGGAIVVHWILLSLTADRPRDTQGPGWLPWLALVLMPIGLALGIASQSAFSARFAWEVQSSPGLSEIGGDAKIITIRTAFGMLDDFPLAGIGADAFGAVANAFRQVDGPAHFSFVESDPVEILLVFGLPVGLIVLGLAALTLFWIVAPPLSKNASQHLTPPALGLAYGLAAVSISAAVSFNVEILGLALPALIVAEVLLANRRRTKRATLSVRSGAVLLAVVAVMGALAGAMHLGLAKSHETLSAALSAPRGDLDAEKLDALALDALSQTPMDGHAVAQVAFLRNVHLGQSGLETTLALAERAGVLAPADPTAHLAAARAAVALGDLDRATKAYRSATETLKPIPTALVGELLVALPGPERRARAIALREDAIRTVIQTLLTQKHHRAALDLAVELQDLAPDVPAAHTYAVRSALAAGEPLLAELYARHMLDAFADSAPSYIVFTDTLLAQKRGAEALPQLAVGIARMPDDPSLRLKRVALILGLPAGAVKGRGGIIKEDLENLRVTSIVNDPTRAHYFYLSGMRWEQLGRMDNAKRDFQKAHRLRPEIAGYKRKAEQK